MANSTVSVPISKGSNPRIVRALQSGRFLHAFTPLLLYRQIIRVGDFTGDADGDQTLDLHTYNSYNLFPANVLRCRGIFRLITPFSGGAVNAVTFELGDADDTDALITATSVFTGVTPGYLPSTPSAAQYSDREELDFIPVVRVLTTGGNVNALTAGELEVIIGFRPQPS